MKKEVQPGRAAAQLLTHSFNPKEETLTRAVLLQTVS